MLATVMAATLLGPATAAAPALAAPAATAEVKTAGGNLYLRTGPATTYATAGLLANGTRLAVTCQLTGETIRGTAGQTALWDRLANGRYVSDAFVAWSPSRPALPTCGAAGGTIRTQGDPLYLRTNASTELSPVGSVPTGAGVSVACQLAGETVEGAVRRTSLWDRLTNGRYVSDAFVAWPGPRPSLMWCVFPYSAPASQGEFISWAAGFAQQGFRNYGVPASVTIAQAILESGWGRSGLTREGSALFGIKCFGTPGPVAAGCRSYATTECADDHCFATTATFRVYRSAAESVDDHGRFLRVNSRYGGAFQHSRSPDRFARAIHRAGYATSPTYADRLIALMRQFNLYRYDS